MKLRGAFAKVLLAVGCGFILVVQLQGQTTERVAFGLSKPVFVTAPSSDPTRLFIVEQGSSGTALIKILNLETNVLNPAPFLTITGLATGGGEQGLLGMAFDPNYATNGKFYVNVTAPGGSFGNGITQIRQYTALTAETASTAFNTVFSLSQPQTNHNGGWIGFSPRPGDGNNLYIAMGDGGNGDDQGTGHFEPGGNAQNTNILLGKMLRIQINSATGTYTNPAGNPFGNEVFAYGLRNPFRASFDRLSGDLFIGDVGQGAREEVDRQLASNPNGGENYGWRLREGTIQTPGSVGGPRPPGNVDPILDYDRTIGTTVTGGYVYRGSANELQGKYLFGDFGSGKLFLTNPDGSGGMQDVTALLNPPGALTIGNVSSFGEDADGDVYIVDYSDGEVYRVVPEPGVASILAVFGLVAAARRRHRC